MDKNKNLSYCLKCKDKKEITNGKILTKSIKVFTISFNIFILKILLKYSILEPNIP